MTTRSTIIGRLRARFFFCTLTILHDYLDVITLSVAAPPLFMIFTFIVDTTAVDESHCEQPSLPRSPPVVP